MLRDSFYAVVLLLSVAPKDVLSQATVDETSVCSGFDGQQPLTQKDSDSETIQRLEVELAQERKRVRQLEYRLAQNGTGTGEMSGTCTTFRKRSVSAVFVSSLYPPDEDRVYGVARGRGEIYLLSRDRKNIRIFADHGEYNHLRDLSIAEANVPHDLVYSNRTNCLYITDYTDRCIWKLTMTDSPRLTRWRQVNGIPRTLSLSREGHVMVVAANFEIYDIVDSNMLRRFELPEDVRTPLNAVQTSQGNYIVSYQDQTPDPNNEGESIIIQLDSRGCLVGQFYPRQDLQRMSQPFHMAVSSSDDYLFVADTYKYRVQLLNSRSLSWEKFLVSSRSNGTDRVFRLHYDDARRQLLVGIWGDKTVRGVILNGRIDVYNIN